MSGSSTYALYITWVNAGGCARVQVETASVAGSYAALVNIYDEVH